MAEIVNETIVINTSESLENFRARVHRLPDGVIVAVPIKEGSRGPLYTSQLTATRHGQLRTTTKHYHLSFDVALNEGLNYAGQCVEKEVEHFIQFMRNNQEEA